MKHNEVPENEFNCLGSYGRNINQNKNSGGVETVLPGPLEPFKRIPCMKEQTLCLCALDDVLAHFYKHWRPFETVHREIIKIGLIKA